MGTLLLSVGALFFSIGTYQLGFVKGYERQIADDKEAESFWKELERKGLK